jgi:hypothetical protein
MSHEEKTMPPGACLRRGRTGGLLVALLCCRPVFCAIHQNHEKMMTQLPALDVNAMGRMVDTLNSKINAALLSDLHDVDIAMRNKSTNAASTFC